MQCYDAVISGAGPAGCSAALFLAAKGHRVLLLDKARFPRDKTCGDGVTAASSSLLEEIGVMEVVKQRLGDLPEIQGVTLSSPAGTVVRGRLLKVKRFSGGDYVIPREMLDDCLVSCVREHPDVIFLDNVAVTSITMDGQRARSLSTSRGDFSGRVIIGADGSYSPLASQLHLNNTSKEHQGFAIRAYFSKVEGLTDTIEIHYDRSIGSGYGWIFPLGEKRANVGVGITSRNMESRKLKRMFEQFIETNPFAVAKLRHARMEPGTLKAYPLPLGSFRGKRSRGNVLLAGDAASFVDPLTGEGIFYALQSGRHAAEAASRAIGEDELRASFYYEKLWRKEFLFHDFRVGYLLQSLLQHEFIMESLLKFASGKQRRADLLAAVIGHNRRKIELLKMLIPFF